MASSHFPLPGFIFLRTTRGLSNQIVAASSSRISPPAPKSGPVKQGREKGGVSVMDERQIAGAERIWHCKALGVGGLSALRRASQAWERMEGELAEKTLSGVWCWWCLVGLGCWCSSQLPPPSPSRPLPNSLFLALPKPPSPPPAYLLSAVPTMEGLSAISLFRQICRCPSQVSPLLPWPNIP